MRIGTWNLDAKWSPAHRDLLRRQRCDVWLLTEVTQQVASPKEGVAGYNAHLSSCVMSRGQHWAAVLSLAPIKPLPDSHQASAAVVVDDITYCSTVLPWAGCSKHLPCPWKGETLEEMVAPTLEALSTKLPRSKTVWGGDWNQNLEGGWEYVGSKGMRSHLNLAITQLGLQVPTAKLFHQLGPGHHSIDHIAVPSNWKVTKAVTAAALGLSDHDACFVEVEPC